MVRMTRLSIFLVPWFLLGVLPVAAAAGPAGESPARPNIIFVVADDMGFKDTGFSGNPVAKTPVNAGRKVQRAAG
jgi:hypothetical protein